jgi:hypothetical protein
VWLEDLRFEDLTLREPPRVTRVERGGGHPRRAGDRRRARDGWRSRSGGGRSGSRSTSARARIRRPHDRLGRGRRAARFEVQAGDDGESVADALSAPRPKAAPLRVLPGGARSRHLRLSLREAAGQDGFGIASLRVEPFEFSRSLHDFFHALAARERRGLYPRWLAREQSYWTPVGVEGGATAAILKRGGDARAPTAPASPSSPSCSRRGELVTWADAEVAQALVEDCLPLPCSRWRWRDLALTTTAFASGEGPHACARCAIAWRTRGAGPARPPVLALRPFR